MIISVDVRETGDALADEAPRAPTAISRIGRSDGLLTSAPEVPTTAAHLLAAAAECADFVVLESCHSTWLFDPVNKRFCRVLKGPRTPTSIATGWRPYDHLLLHADSDAFVVFLDSSGTRLLRSWRHTAHCDQCGGEVTAELSLADLRRVARA